jgi:hypothetical protein
LKRIDKIFTDSGGEFKGSVSKFLADNGITQILSNPSDFTKLRTSMVERYHRTLLNKIRKLQEVSGTLNWIDYLNDLTYNYNNSIHSSIKAKPVDVIKNSTQPKINVNENDKKIDDIITHFPVGSKVRVRNVLSKFEKRGREQLFGNEIYYVIGREYNRFVLMDDSGDVLDQRYPAHMLFKVDDSVNAELVSENVRKEKRIVKKKQKLTRLQRKEVAIGHEAKEISETGDIVYKERLQPKSDKRKINKPKRFDL